MRRVSKKSKLAARKLMRRRISEEVRAPSLRVRATAALVPLVTVPPTTPHPGSQDDASEEEEEAAASRRGRAT